MGGSRTGLSLHLRQHRLLHLLLDGRAEAPCSMPIMPPTLAALVSSFPPFILFHALKRLPADVFPDMFVG